MRRPTNPAESPKGGAMHHRSRGTRPYGIALVIAVLVASVAASSAPARESETVAKAPYKLGLAAALSGPFAAAAGIPYADGTILAVREINRSGGIDGHPIKLYVEDHKADPATGALLMNKFKSEGVPVVISNFTAILKAQAPIAAQNNMLLLNAGGSEGSVATAGKTVYTTRPYGAREYHVMSTYIQQSGAKSIAIVSVDTANGRDATRVMTADLKRKGLSVEVTEFYSATTNDFSSQIAKVRIARPDAIWLYNTGADGGIFLKQARAQGLRQQVYGYGGLGVPDVVNAAGDAADGAIFTIPVYFQADGTNKTQRAFAQRFTEAFPGVQPSFLSALHYDVVKSVLVPAIRRAIKKGLGYNGPGLIKAMRQLRKFPAGVTGPTFLTPGRDSIKPMAIMTVKNGQFSLVRYISIASQLPKKG